MISHAKDTFNFGKKEMASTLFYIITQKGQAILFLSLFLLVEQKIET